MHCGDKQTAWFRYPFSFIKDKHFHVLLSGRKEIFKETGQTASFHGVFMAALSTTLLTAHTVILLLVLRDVSSVPCTFDDDDGESRVHCNNRRMTKFPVTWPVSHVTWLDISNNLVTSCRGLSDQHLNQLRYLDVHDNQIHKVPAEDLHNVPLLQYLDLSGNPLVVLSDRAFKHVPSLTYLGLRSTSMERIQDEAIVGLSVLTRLDLSQNRLHTVPTSAVARLGRLQSLDLSHNAISEMADDSFSALVNLRSLSLAGNKLRQISVGVFRGLSRLTHLDLSKNALVLTNTTYAPGVFGHLPALQSLRIANNDPNNDGIYPLGVFRPLPSLRSLSIDAFRHNHFGEAFSSLKNLTHLYLDENCQMTEITNSTFTAFQNSSLEVLSISCAVGPIDLCAFCHLPKLHTLRLQSNSHLRLGVALLSMYGLQNQSLKVIDMSGNKYRVEMSALDQDNTRYLATMCVERLLVRESLIGSFATSSFNHFRGRFASCLKHLDISLNSINNWMIERLNLRVLVRLRNLETLQAQNQHTRTIQRDVCSIQPERCQDDYQYKTDIRRMTCYLSLPSIRLINLSGFIDHTSALCQTIHLYGANNLTSLDMSYLGIHNLNIGLLGMGALTDLNMRGNFFRQFNKTIFYEMPALRRLDLSSVHFDPTFLLAEGKLVFSKLRLLEDLDLSFNTLPLLQNDLLTAQSNLRRLVLANNRFQNVPVDVLHLSNLTELDLRSNVISSLTAEERRVMDAMARRTPSFTLRLTGNPLSCSCANLPFVQWLAHTSVRLDGQVTSQGYDDDYDDNGRVFTCWLNDGSLSDTGQVMAEWRVHWRRCNGLQVLSIALSLLSLQILGIMVAFLVSRNWTHLRYVLHAVRNYRMPTRQDFRKDLYVGYADADVEMALEVNSCLQLQRGVDLLLRYQEELPGSVRAESIVQNIDDCWKVLLIVTQAMTQDEWMAFTLMEAQRSISDKMPDRVIIVFRDNPLGLSHMPALNTLLRVVPERNVFHVPRGSSHHHPGWDCIAHLVLSSPPVS